MSGTVEGFKKARIKLIERFGGEEGYKAWRQEIGARGGRNGRGEGYTGGFAHPSANPIESGRKGGRVSKRTKVVR